MTVIFLVAKVNGRGPDDSEITAYVQRVKKLADDGCRIKLVQVYSVARRTAETNVTPLDEEALAAVAEGLGANGIAAQAY